MDKTIAIDLHTHSILSYDGGITEKEYESVLSTKKLDCIAITDHNTIDFALSLHKKLGEKIIVGEEIMTVEGELVGLFLTKPIPPFLSAKETIDLIREQNGLVYVPHPFEIIRKGVSQRCVGKIVEEVDVVEVYNARAFLNNCSDRAYAFAESNKKAMAASSDAHGVYGVGSAYSLVGQIPTRESLVQLLLKGSRQEKRAPFFSLFFPSINKVKKIIASRGGTME